MDRPHRGAVFAAAGTIRYRFFLLAGAFPYLLGVAVAYGATGSTNPAPLILGLVGVVSLGLGIEGMNEYFDSMKGGDRVFASTRRARTWWHLPLGAAGFTLALIVALCLTVLRGWPVLAFALCGGVIALAYLMPPVHLSYRGLGEALIAAGYGPGLTVGSFYLQTGRLSTQALLASLVPGLAMFALVLANEVPDYYGDRLVGKRNLVVRMGRRRGVMLYGLVLASWFGLLAAGLMAGVFPPLLGLCFLLMPMAWRSVRYGLRHCENPGLYVRVIRTTILGFMLVNTVAIVSYCLR